MHSHHLRATICAGGNLERRHVLKMRRLDRAPSAWTTECTLAQVSELSVDIRCCFHIRHYNPRIEQRGPGAVICWWQLRVLSEMRVPSETCRCRDKNMTGAARCPLSHRPGCVYIGQCVFQLTRPQPTLYRGLRHEVILQRC